jgi:hypothetical protein
MPNIIELKLIQLLLNETRNVGDVAIKPTVVGNISLSSWSQVDGIFHNSRGHRQVKGTTERRSFFSVCYLIVLGTIIHVG